jgi:hypothetical protein
MTGEELLHNRRCVARCVIVTQKQERNCYTTGDVGSVRYRDADTGEELLHNRRLGSALYHDAETGEELLLNRRCVAGPVTVMQKQERNCYTTGDVGSARYRDAETGEGLLHNR